MNKVFLVGSVQKFEQRMTNAGKPVLNFTVMTSRTYNGQTFVTYHQCVAFGRAAEQNPHLPPGSVVSLVGSLNNRSYQDQSGQKKYVTEVNADEISYIAYFEPQQQDNGGITL